MYLRSDSPAPERELGGGEGDAPGPGATVQFSESDEDDEGADLSDCVDEDALAVLEGKQSVEEYRNMVEAQRREQEEQNAAAAAAEAQRKREEEERQSRPQGRHVNVGLRRLPVPSLSPVSTSQSESRSRSEAPAPRVHGVLRPLDSSVHGRSFAVSPDPYPHLKTLISPIWCFSNPSHFVSVFVGLSFRHRFLDFLFSL